MKKAIAPYAVLVVAGLALFSDPVAGAQVLAAEELKKKIAALSVPREEEISERRKTAQIVENDLSRFIVHRLQTRSANGECDLERQLRNLFNEESSVACHGADSGLTEAPQVFMQEIGTGRRQVIVMYELYLACIVEGCTVPVFENYLYENGKARRTVRLDSFLNGYLTQRELLGSSAETHQFWVLMSAMMSGSSGRLLGRQALLLQFGTESINVRWRSAILANLEVHRVEASKRWELEYVDDSLYPDGPDKQVIEVYKFDKPSSKVQRIMRYHQP